MRVSGRKLGWSVNRWVGADFFDGISASCAITVSGIYAVSLFGTGCHQSQISFCRFLTYTERSENGLSFAGIKASTLATAFAPSDASSSPLNR
jgi:hypothetical protein